jgi:hypothetical protein
VRAGNALDGLIDVVASPTVAVALRTVREALGMEIAYTSELIGEHFVVREVDGDAASFGLAGELALPRAQTFCQRMLDGRIPYCAKDADRTSTRRCSTTSSTTWPTRASTPSRTATANR